MPITSFEKKVAVVTGAARGLGAALAGGLATSGCLVALVDRDGSVVRQASRLGGGHRGYVVDVSERTAVASLARTVAADFGRVDLVVNNAGVAAAGPFEQVPLDDLAWVMNVNFWGTVHGCHSFLPLLRGQREGHIVNVVSSFAWLGFPNKSAYAASKAAVRALSESLRAELHGTGIGVTLLFPGPLDTELVRESRATDAAKRDAEARFLAERALPLERVVARTIRAIRRDQARVVVGADYHLVDAAARLAPSLTLAAVARMSRKLPF